MIAANKQKVTIALDKDIYQGLVSKVGKRKLGVFLSQIARPYIDEKSLDEAYQAMAAFEANDIETTEWLNADIDAPIQD